MIYFSLSKVNYNGKFMKKSLITVIAATALICAVGASGCAGPTKSVVALNSNWFSNTTFKSIQPTFINTADNAQFSREEVNYDVKFVKSEVGNITYSVEYAEGGTYNTIFYAQPFDIESEFVCSEFKESYKDAAKKGITAYFYKTELNIPSVTFTCGTERETFENQTQVTECWFLSVENKLQPLYAKTIEKCATPAALQANDLKSAYRLVDCEYVNYYNFNGSAVKTVKTDNLAQTNKETVTVKENLSEAQSTLFDVAQIEIVARAQNLGDGSFSQGISLYTPASGVNGYILTGGPVLLTESDKTAFTDILKPHGLYEDLKDGEGNSKGLQTTAVTLTYNSSMAGYSPSYIFTAVNNKRNNAGRATMVKAIIPIAFSHGNFEYNLKSIASTFWNE